MRLRFNKRRIQSAFNNGYKKATKATKATKTTATVNIDALNDLVESDKDALDEMVKEMDQALGEILNKKKKSSDGETCTKCKEFFPFAEPNQPDDTLICYSCRTYG